MADTRLPYQDNRQQRRTDPSCDLEQPPPVILLRGPGSATDRRRHYVAGSTGHPDRMPHELAATLLREYSRPADLVLDPLAGTGTTLVEACRAGRDAVGIEYEPGWAALARASLTLAGRHGAGGHARILCRDATQLPRGLPRHLRGTVALVLTAPPAGRTMPGRAAGACSSKPAAASTSTVATGRDRVERIALVPGVAAVLAGCLPLLMPGARILIVTRPRRHYGVHVDPSGQVLQAGLLAGLRLTAVRHAVRTPAPPVRADSRPAVQLLAAQARQYTIAVFQRP